MSNLGNIILLPVTLMICLSGISQVGFDHRIEMTGLVPTERKILNLGSPDSSQHAVNLMSAQSGQLVYAQTTFNGDSITCTLTPELEQYQIGTVIRFISPIDNQGDVRLNVNNLGWLPLLKNVTEELTNQDIKLGYAYTVIHDSVAFQLMNVTLPDCPNGYVKVNTNYCIETDERSAMLWYDAVADCKSEGARLCTWPEWYYACQKTGLGLLNATNNWEWIDDTANHIRTASQTGNTACTNERSITVYASVSPYNYRCCFYRNNNH